MRVFVLGATGMLGSYVYKFFQNCDYDVIGTPRCFGHDARDFENSNLGLNLEKAEREHRHILVINCIGAIKQKQYNDAEIMLAVNGAFPIKLARYVNKFKHSQMIHISSDCVFSGDSNKAYYDSAVRDATDPYGQSKIVGEECAKIVDCKVVRTSIIGEDRRSKVSLLEWVRSHTEENAEVAGYINHWWNGVTCLQLACFLSDFADHFESMPDLVNYYSNTVLSKYDLIKKIIDCYGLNISVIPMGTDRAVNRQLASVYLDFIQHYLPPSIDEQLLCQKEFQL